MATVVLGALAEGILRKILSLAAEEISSLWGLKNDLRKLAEKVRMINGLLYDSENKQMRSNKAFHLWLKKLQSVASDADDLLDKFAYEVLRQKTEKEQARRDKLRSFFSSSNPLALRLSIAHKITQLEEVYKEANDLGIRAVEILNLAMEQKRFRMTDPFVDDSDIVGRTDDVFRALHMLTDTFDDENLSVVGLVGMPGQGKTALAKLLYKKDEMVAYFDKRIWICGSDDFVVESILNEMLQSLTQMKSELTNREAIVKKLQEYLNQKRFLLVLDDVWNEDGHKWESLKNCLLEVGGSKGSKVMVTTRSAQSCSSMKITLIHYLGVLSKNDSWNLFTKIAFADGGAKETRELATIGRRIVERCGGLPLAIKALGGLMYAQKDEHDRLIVENSELWSSSNDFDGVLPTLRLSYDHLPSPLLKQCFSFCSIFPKDSIIEKEKLIQLWMAHGFLNSSTDSHLEMESLGNNYFNILLWNSLLQDIKKDDYDNIESCKMHDLVHDLALHTSDGHHLIVLSNDEFSISAETCLNFRTLHLTGCSIGDKLKSFLCLRVLILDGFNIVDLPKSIGKLKHLRYLDVSRTSIKSLPDKITKLYFLQTLRLKELEQIPNDLVKLVNLRHFYLEDTEKNRLNCMPAGIGQLIHLRTVPFFVVNQDRPCKIEELGGLQNLNGFLKIYGLENVKNSEEAMTAKLSSKSSIQVLELHWTPRERRSVEADDEDEDEDVLAGLIPHVNLKGLLIEYFNAAKFPPWMTMKSHSSLFLKNLVKISILDCNRCEQIPPLGHLPCLEKVEIRFMHKVESIDSEFYGLLTLEDFQAATMVFPVLKEMTLTSMSSLFEWREPMHLSPTSIKVFPNLRSLTVGSCPELTCLPSMNNLHHLTWLNVYRLSRLTYLPENLGNLESLQGLVIRDCSNLVSFPNFSGLKSLHYLLIDSCQKLSSLPDGLETCKSLSILYIDSCPSLQPESLNHIACLNLRMLHIGGFSDQLDYFPWPSISFDEYDSESSEKQCNFFVTNLTLCGWPRLKYLPEQLQHLSTLKCLRIENFSGLRKLPEWLDNLTSLEKLEIYCCSNLMSLPSSQAMKRLANLQKLEVRNCPVLEDYYADECNLELDKITPHVEINRKRFQKLKF